MTLNDELSNLMVLELVAPSRQQAMRLGRAYEERAEQLYNLIIDNLTAENDLAD